MKASNNAKDFIERKCPTCGEIWIQIFPDLISKQAVIEPLEGISIDVLKTKVTMLKQTDGESWAIGEVIERLIKELEQTE